MKKILCILCIIPVLLCLGACGKKAQPTSGDIKPKTASVSPNWQKIAEKNEVKIGVPSLENNFDNELIDEFARELNIPVTKILTKNTDFKTAISDGSIDMYWGLYPKEAKDSIDYTLSTPYLTTTALLLKNASSNKTADKETSVVGAVKNSPEEIIASDKFANVKTYNSESEVLEALKAGSIDFASVNNSTYEKSKYAESGQFSEENSSMYNLVIVFKNGYTDVATEADKVLAKVKASGKASEVCEKWYGKDLISK